MNREIKFRGKPIHQRSGRCQSWLYGMPTIFRNGHAAIRWQCSDKAKTPEAWKTQSVILETLGQYIGLKDRNGKEIYEGDIITVRGDYPRVVLWDKMSWAIMPCELYNDKHFWVMNLQHPGSDWWEEFADEMEVIGNIYDNPEFITNKR